MSGVWYYGRGTEQSGPMSIEELRARLVRDGNLADAYVWREGFDVWKRAPEVSDLFPSKPPPLPVMPVTATARENDALPAVQPAPVAQADSGGRKAAVWCATIVGGIIGIGLSRALGAIFWLPAISIFGVWVILAKLKAPSWAVPMLALVGGHTIWIGIGIAVLFSTAKATSDNLLAVSDVVIVFALMAWVLRAQSKASCFGVLAYGIMGLGMNVLTLSEQNPSISAAMVVHVVLRLFEIAATLYALRTFPPTRNQSATVPEVA